jgi:hypothetical protein
MEWKALNGASLVLPSMADNLYARPPRGNRRCSRSGRGGQIGSELLGIPTHAPARSCQFRERELGGGRKLLWSNVGNTIRVAWTVQDTARFHVGTILPDERGLFKE